MHTKPYCLQVFRESFLNGPEVVLSSGSPFPAMAVGDELLLSCGLAGILDPDNFMRIVEIRHSIAHQEGEVYCLAMFVRIEVGIR